jgi:ABC-2 type transport system ATP-binding protein
MSLAIETRDLVKVYKDGKTSVRALDGVDMRVPQGSVFGFFGPNGSGKTTMISILVGLLLPTSGEAKVLGLDAVRESVEIRRKVGLLPEGFGLYEHMTALENLTFLGMLDDLPQDRIRTRALEVLEAVGLQDRANDKVSSFSRGMKQRMGMAQAILKDPELLILDEPTVGIDPDGAADFRNAVRAFSGRGKTVLMSTHLLHEIGMLCTHAAVIRKGRIMAQGSVDELSRPVRDAKGHAYEIQVKSGGDVLLQEVRRLPETREAELRDGKLVVVADSDIGNVLFSIAAKGQCEIESLTPTSPSWEDIYQFYEKGD